MTTYIALLRGINVGGNRKVALADLLALPAALGFERARTLLQSGNVVFRAREPSGAALETLLEAEADRRLGLRTSFLVRDAREWAGVVARNPFPDAAERDPARLVVVCLKAAPAPSAVSALQDAVKGPEIIRADGRQLYITYPAGTAESRLTSTVIDGKLGTIGTARNWNTVLKIAASATAP